MSTSPSDPGFRRLYHRRVGAAWRFDRSGKVVLGDATEFIDHLLRLQDLAEASGQSFEAFVQEPAAHVAYAARAVERIRRALGREKASHRKVALLDVMATLEKDGALQLRILIEAGLRAYARRHTPTRGNPNKLRGTAANPVRTIVNAAIHELVSAELREEKDFMWLFVAGRPGSPSPGHRAILQRARTSADSTSLVLSDRALSRQVTEATRSIRALGPRAWAIALTGDRFVKHRKKGRKWQGDT